MCLLMKSRKHNTHTHTHTLKYTCLLEKSIKKHGRHARDNMITTTGILTNTHMLVYVRTNKLS
jgi:hypothetical protein